MHTAWNRGCVVLIRRVLRLTLRAQSSMVEGPAQLDLRWMSPWGPRTSIRGDARLCGLATVQLKEHVLDLRHRRLVDLLVDADGRQRREEIWVNVRVREVARAREELLDIGLVRRRALNLCLAAHVDFRRGDCNQKLIKIMISPGRD